MIAAFEGCLALVPVVVAAGYVGGLTSALVIAAITRAVRLVRR